MDGTVWWWTEDLTEFCANFHLNPDATLPALQQARHRTAARMSSPARKSIGDCSVFSPFVDYGLR